MLITPSKTKRSDRPRRPRSLNVTLIKRCIVFMVGCATAFASAVTGLGAQVAFAPMLTWMLGFKADKAQASGLVFACLAAVFGVGGALVGQSTPPEYWQRGVLLFVGAVLGALMAGRFAPITPSLAWKRWSFRFGIILCLFVVVRIGRLSRFDNPELALWQSGIDVGLIAVAVGAATRTLGLPSGLLMVPALYLFCAFTPSESISLSLLVIALASILPAIGYVQ